MAIDRLASATVNGEQTPRDQSGLTNQPEVKVKGNKAVNRRRAVTDVGQLKSIVVRLITENDERNKKNARIMAKYNAEKPYLQRELDAEGLGWKANFTTKPLATLIDRVAPRFRMAVEGVKYLTDARLPEDWPGATTKNEYFRKCVTETIRQKRGWVNLVDELSQENALFGWTTVATLDDVSWFPRHFRQDQAFIAKGTRQNVGECQAIVFKESYMLHEFLDKWGEDLQAARDAGWDTDACIEVLNAAMPTARQSKYSGDERVYEDMVRECSSACNYEDGARMVVVYHVLVAETSGAVSHYIIDEKKEKQLFGRFDRYKSMSECCSFFSFQLGSATMHGSKGIGREIYNMASAVDRMRNEVADRLILAGKLVIQGDSKMLKRFRMSVIGNAILIDTAYNIAQQRVDGNVEPFFMLDNYFRDLLDQMAGSASPKILKGERVTKAAVDLYAEREEEGRDSVMGRFLFQFADMVSLMTKRLCSKNADDEDAKALRKRLQLKLTDEEIELLSNRPSIRTVQDLTDVQRQQIVVLASEAKGNPLYNQREIEKRKVSALIDEAFAEAVLLPDNDPTEEAEQTRLQNMELLLLRLGQEVGVSTRDSHDIHLQIVLDDVEKVLIPSAAEDPVALDVAKLALNHAKAHIQVAIQFGAQGAYDAQLNKIQELEQVIAQVEAQAQAQAQAQDQQLQAGLETGIVPPEAAAPPMPPEATLPATPGFVA